jgi:hypothetical protein
MSITHEVLSKTSLEIANQILSRLDDFSKNLPPDSDVALDPPLIDKDTLRFLFASHISGALLSSVTVEPAVAQRSANTADS